MSALSDPRDVPTDPVPPIVRPWLSDGEPLGGHGHFSSPPRALIIHETVTRSRDDTVAVLRRRELSVHFIIDPDGYCTQHVPLDSIAWHCGSHNGAAIGVEVVTPYYPSIARVGDPWERSIAAPWADGGRYLLPTEAQAETVAELARMLIAEHGIPSVWPAVSSGVAALEPVATCRAPVPGIYAHHHVGGHADGAWLTLYAWLRLVAGLDAERAYAEAVRRATGVRAASVGELV